MRFQPYRCHMCGNEIGGKNDDISTFLRCCDCGGHYCSICYLEHMLMGHTVDLGRNLDMFDVVGG